jgi:hypothetical protein
VEYLLERQAAQSAALENARTMGDGTSGALTTTKFSVHVEVFADCPFSVT